MVTADPCSVPGMSEPVRPRDGDDLDAAWASGTLEVLGRVVGASNGTLLVEVTGPKGRVRCIHKPVAGERPLWDFPDGTLAEREVASYRLSRLAGFDVVPPTALVDGPFGMGMLQRFIDAAPVDRLVRIDPPGRTPPQWCEVLEGLDGDGADVVLAHAPHPALRRMALFDAVVNNSDRKGLHLLADPGSESTVWGVDHGLTWHAQDKLRTILWGWAGHALSMEERELVQRAEVVLDECADLITGAEINAARERCRRLLDEGTFPEPSPDWPSIPWPPM